MHVVLVGSCIAVLCLLDGRALAVAAACIIVALILLLLTRLRTPRDYAD